ncbi:hypothetical protein THAOC_36798, partial [Thalassiosira oceanica]
DIPSSSEESSMTMTPPWSSGPARAFAAGDGRPRRPCSGTGRSWARPDRSSMWPGVFDRALAVFPVFFSLPRLAKQGIFWGGYSFPAKGSQGPPTPKIEAPDRLTNWPIRKPSAWGIAERPPKGQGRPLKRAFIENSALASVRECPSSAKRGPRRTPLYRSCRAAGTLDGVVEIGRKAASRKALAELTRSTNSGRRSPRCSRAREKRHVRRLPEIPKPSRLREEEDARGTTAA